MVDFRQLIENWALSFYSRDFYHAVARKWKGIAAPQLALLLFFISIPYTIVLEHNVTQMVDKSIPYILDDLPTIHIHNGTAIVAVSYTHLTLPTIYSV